jgi:selenoprotein W-related protein
VAGEIIHSVGDSLAEITVVPSHGGVFDIVVGEKTVFSKKSIGRFPEEGEATRLVQQAL